VEIVSKKISDLLFDPNNARKHDDKNLGAIKGSLAKFGQQKPIVVDAKGIILAGNGTAQAAKALGWDEIDCVVTTLDGFNAAAYGLADNRSSELADWDTDILSKTLKNLREIDFDIEAIGFDESFLKIEPPVFEGDPDEVPENVETRCKPGDLWILGNHRLLCGDSTNVQHVERLMGGEKADMVFTDPPYGMDLDTDFSSLGKIPVPGTNSREHHSKNYRRVIGDEEDFDPGIIIQVFSSAREVFLWGFDYFAHRLPALSERGSLIVWDKREKLTGETPGSEFEICWSREKHKRKIFRYTWSGVYGMPQQDNKKRLHPTQKPVQAGEWFFEQWGKPNDLVVDLFLGSGSTLIACEKTNRKCYGCEIDAHYCDVIISRWEKFTGKTALLSTD
jgi:DNA modification methylase